MRVYAPDMWEAHLALIELIFTLTNNVYRWDTIRATEGWAGLQHHALLHTTITVTPPSLSSQNQGAEPPRLLVELLEGSFFTILPSHDARGLAESIPKWYLGNIYALNPALPQTVPLPIAPSLREPTTYEIFVSGDYEVRMCSPFSHTTLTPPSLGRSDSLVIPCAVVKRTAYLSSLSS